MDDDIEIGQIAHLPGRANPNELNGRIKDERLHRKFAEEMKVWHEKFGKDTKQRLKENKAHFEAQRPMWREAENCLQQLGFVRSTNPLAQEQLKKVQPSSD